MVGIKSTNALVAMIFEKQFKISSATNKRFTTGEMVNFVQVDSMKMQWLSQQAPQVMRLPILIILSYSILFYFLGWTFISGLVITVITFYVNIGLSRYAARLQRVFMKNSDARIRCTTESLNNIKTLKLFAWTHIFAKLI